MINGIVIDKKSRMVYKYEAAKIKVGESQVKNKMLLVQISPDLAWSRSIFLDNLA